MQISPVQQFESLNYPAVQEETGQDMKKVYVCNLKLLDLESLEIHVLEIKSF